MKVLYCSHGNYWGSTWPYAFIDKYIINALTEMGHKVDIFDLFEHAEMVSAYLEDFTRKNNANKEQKMAVFDYFASAPLPLQVLESKPDLLLHIVGRIHPDVLYAMKPLNVEKAIWYLDDPQEIEKTSVQGTYYDHVFTVESSCVEKHKKTGAKTIDFLPLGCDPAIHKKMEVEEKYKSDLCFIGVPFKRRIEFFDSIADFLAPYNVKIIGGGPNIGNANDPWMWKNKLKRLDILEKFIVDDIVFPDEAAKYYNGAKININMHRGAVDERFSRLNKSLIIPTGVSGRTFEIAGCAAFQLVDDSRSDIYTHFEKDKEMVSFHDEGEFKEKARYFLEHEAERDSISEKAQKKAYSVHTYKKRLELMLSRLKDRNIKQPPYYVSG